MEFTDSDGYYHFAPYAADSDIKAKYHPVKSLPDEEADGGWTQWTPTETIWRYIEHYYADVDFHRPDPYGGFRDYEVTARMRERYLTGGKASAERRSLHVISLGPGTERYGDYDPPLVPVYYTPISAVDPTATRVTLKRNFEVETYFSSQNVNFPFI